MDIKSVAIRVTEKIVTTDLNKNKAIGRSDSRYLALGRVQRRARPGKIYNVQLGQIAKNNRPRPFLFSNSRAY